MGTTVSILLRSSSHSTDSLGLVMLNAQGQWLLVSSVKRRRIARRSSAAHERKSGFVPRSRKHPGTATVCTDGQVITMSISADINMCMHLVCAQIIKVMWGEKK